MPEPIRRRDFLRRAAGSIPLLAIPAAPPRSTSMHPHPALLRRKPLPIDPAEPHALKIIDTHQHLWDLSKLRLPWLTGDTPLNHSFTMDDYLAATKHVNVIKTVYMEVGVAPDQRVAEAEYVIGLCERKDNPMAAAVIGGDPSAPEFKEYISRYRRHPYVKGVRSPFRAPSSPGGSFDPEYVKGVRLLGELGLSYDLLVSPGQIRDAARLVDACPHTHFILDHCGNPDVQAVALTGWEQEIGELAKRKRVVCKVSGFVASAKPKSWKPEDLEPIVRYVMDVFGSERVMYGGDWPVCTKVTSLLKWTQALAFAVRIYEPQDQAKLFYDNAARIYGLH